MIHAIPVSRRGWLRCSTGAAAAALCGWLPALAAKSDKLPDLIATVAKAVGIDPAKQNMSNVGRPIRVADPAAKPIEDLL